MSAHDECPSCGSRMAPALVGSPRPPDLETGPLLADAPVRLFCPACAGDDTSSGQLG